MATALTLSSLSSYSNVADKIQTSAIQERFNNSPDYIKCDRVVIRKAGWLRHEVTYALDVDLKSKTVIAYYNNGRKETLSIDLWRKDGDKLLFLEVKKPGTDGDSLYRAKLNTKTYIIELQFDVSGIVTETKCYPKKINLTLKDLLPKGNDIEFNVITQIISINENLKMILLVKNLPYSQVLE